MRGIDVLAVEADDGEAESELEDCEDCGDERFCTGSLAHCRWGRCLVGERGWVSVHWVLFVIEVAGAVVGAWLRGLLGGLFFGLVFLGLGVSEAEYLEEDEPH